VVAIVKIHVVSKLRYTLLIYRIIIEVYANSEFIRSLGNSKRRSFKSLKPRSTINYHMESQIVSLTKHISKKTYVKSDTYMCLCNGKEFEEMILLCHVIYKHKEKFVILKAIGII